MRLALDVPVSDEFEAEAARLIDARLPSRLQQQDAELFDGAEDAAERMGWVDLPHQAEDLLTRIEALRADSAVEAADTVLLTIPSQLGVDYNLHILESFAEHVAPALGWRPNSEGPVQPDPIDGRPGA